MSNKRVKEMITELQVDISERLYSNTRQHSAWFNYSLKTKLSDVYTLDYLFDYSRSKYLYQLCAMDICLSTIRRDRVKIVSPESTVFRYSKSTRWNAIAMLKNFNLIVGFHNHYQGNIYVLISELGRVSPNLEYTARDVPEWYEKILDIDRKMTPKEFKQSRMMPTKDDLPFKI